MNIILHSIYLVSIFSAFAGSIIGNFLVLNLASFRNRRVENFLNDFMLGFAFLFIISLISFWAIR
jgi:putative flippase GtrA